MEYFFLLKFIDVSGGKCICLCVCVPPFSIPAFEIREMVFSFCSYIGPDDFLLNLTFNIMKYQHHHAPLHSDNFYVVTHSSWIMGIDSFHHHFVKEKLDYRSAFMESISTKSAVSFV